MSGRTLIPVKKKKKKSKLHRNGAVHRKTEEVNLRTMTGKSIETFPCALCVGIYQESGTEYICKILAPKGI